MVCGINWGGDPGEEQRALPESFFSDARVNSDRFVERLVRWFGLWGHPLARQDADAGAFERSIIQTNWLTDKSVSVRGRHLRDECLKGWADFYLRLKTHRPSLLLFASSQLLDILNAPELRDDLTHTFGKIGAVNVVRRDVPSEGRVLRRFRVGFQVIGGMQVIALPHPTGSIGLADEYVAAFMPEIGDALTAYKARRGIA